MTAASKNPINSTNMGETHNLITCIQCTSYQPSPYESTQGLGMCGELVKYMQKLGRKIKNTEHEKIMKAIGNSAGGKLTYPLVERICLKFNWKGVAA